MDGYAGKLLNLNLSDGTGKEFVIPEDVIQKYLGGRGLGAWLLYKGLEPHVDPLDPDNVLLLMTGPLTGLGLPGVNHLSICTKSPLTGTIVDSSLGGEFAVRLKSCGYDGVILRGRSPRPVFVDITEGRWKIRDGGKLWGQNVVRTQELLASNVAGVLCIGVAGENMVRFASIVSGEHMARQGGAGAVMGSKLVKAIRVGGSFEASVFDRDRLKKPADSIREKLRLAEVVPGPGTAQDLASANEKGVLPTRNFAMGSFDQYLKIGGEALRASIKRKALDCPGCPISCCTEIKLSTKSGIIRIKGPGYQSLVMLGSNLLIDDLESIIRNSYLCFLLGLDPVSLGGSIAMAMELSEKGRMDLPLRFGSQREVGPLLPLIAARRGPGDEIAEGAASLAHRYGYNDLAMVIKGMEISGFDPRGCWGQGLGYATCPAGGTHIGSMMAAPEVLGRPIAIPGPKATGKVPLTIFAQNLQTSLACVGACGRAMQSLVTLPPFVYALPHSVVGFFAGRTPRIAASFLDFNDYYRALSFVTGVRYDRRTFIRAGERVFNLERLFNLREGFTSRDDSLPLRFIGEPFRDGPIAGKVVPIPKMLLKYYRLRGWSDVGTPTSQHLHKLGIDERL